MVVKPPFSLGLSVTRASLSTFLQTLVEGLLLFLAGTSAAKDDASNAHQRTERGTDHRNTGDLGAETLKGLKGLLRQRTGDLVGTVDGGFPSRALLGDAVVPDAVLNLRLAHRHGGGKAIGSLHTGRGASMNDVTVVAASKTENERKQHGADESVSSVVHLKPRQHGVDSYIVFQSRCFKKNCVRRSATGCSEPAANVSVHWGANRTGRTVDLHHSTCNRNSLVNPVVDSVFLFWI